MNWLSILGTVVTAVAQALAAFLKERQQDKRTITHLEQAHETDVAVAGADSAELDRLRDRWTRKPRAGE